MVKTYFIFGALCPSKSGLMNKHIVETYRDKHIASNAVFDSRLKCPSVYRETNIVKPGSLRGQYLIFGALYPSQSGLINKHTVKRIV